MKAAKAKIKATFDSTQKRDVKHACEVAVSALQTTLGIVTEASGEAGVPGLKAGLTGLSFIIAAVKVDSPLFKFI